MTLRRNAACVWHAYTALGEQSGKNAALKGQLKVLTHNLASLFHMTEVEKKLDSTFSSDNIITFPEYLNFLNKVLFEPLNETNPDNTTPALSLDQIDSVCWYICSRSYVKQNAHLLSDSDVYNLWRLFNFLSETDDDGETMFPVVIDREEVELVLQRIIAMLAMEHKKLDLESIMGDKRQFEFAQFLDIIENHCLAGKEANVASDTVAELFDEQFAQTIKKGYLHKKGHGLTGGWKDCWCVLTYSHFNLYSNRNETELKENLAITKSCKVENLTEKSGITIGNIGLGVKSNRFSLSNEANKVIELNAPDAKTKSEWLTAIATALDWSSRSSSPKLLALQNRKLKRKEKRELLEKEAESKRRKEEELVKTLIELGSEKQARLDAEERIRQEEAKRQEDQRQMEETMKLLEEANQARERAELLLQEEAHLRELEQQRLRELEEMRAQLEALLDAERRAKHEEEIVRAMQTRILQEEFEKQDKLEKMQGELEKMLQEEQLKNIGLEELRMKQEAIIREEQEKLKLLEVEKVRQEQEHQTAILKLQEAEQMKAQMEEHLKQKEEEQAKLAARLKNTVALQIGTHRGLGAFVDADYIKRTDLTPTSPSYNFQRICRTPISPLPRPDLVKSTDKKNEYTPPVPPKRRNRSNLDSLGSSEVEEPISPKTEWINDEQKAELVRCVEARVAATSVSEN